MHLDAAGRVALIVVGRRQKAGTLQRNWLAGLRTSETMRSDAAWHAAHTAPLTLVLVATAGVRGHRLATHVNRGGAEDGERTT